MKRKGLSPVIATVILIAVTIVCAVSVSFWMSGISGTYMKNERLEISYNVVSDVTGWNITYNLKNKGSSIISFDETLVNRVPISECSPIITSTGFGTLASGQTGPGTIFIPIAYSTPGTTVEITIRTNAGQDYPGLVGLS